MNAEPNLRRILRRGAPLAAAAAIGAGTGAGVYALTDGGGTAGSSATAAAPTAIVPAQSAAQRTTATTLTQLYKDAAPGVVDITVDSNSTSGTGGFGNPFGGPGQQRTQAEGSGFVIDTKGDIVTNEHVVDGATKITVRFQDGTKAAATLVGSDKTTDIAVVKVNLPASQLHPLALGSSSGVEPGQEVVAIGSPFGLPESMTAGIVSAIDRTITAPNNFSISGAIQTDAAINHGNSGGPLIDVASGTVVGVNAQIESDSGGNNGVGFAIPIDAAKKVADTLVAGGKVQHAYLGVRITDATSGAGVQVGYVYSGSPADSAGLKAGDVITAIDGKSVANADALSADIGRRAPGDKVTLTVDRNGTTKQVDVTLGTQPS